MALCLSRYSHHSSVCVCLSLSLSPSHNHHFVAPPPVSPPSLLPCGVCLSCAYCRLALDDAIRHKQLNISRFSPRVAGENDFLQTVINKVITAKEVNHKGQGTVQRSKSKNQEPPFIPLMNRTMHYLCYMFITIKPNLRLDLGGSKVYEVKYPTVLG